MALEKIGKYLRDLMTYRSINIDIDIIKFESAIKRMFKDWEMWVQNKLAKQYTTKSLIEKALNKKEIEAIARIKLGSHPKRLATISQAVAQKGLEHSYTDINAVLSWDINMSPLADFYVSNYKTFTNKISQSLQDRIRNEIALGVRDGTPYPELSKKVRAIFSKPIPVHVAAKLNRKGEVIRRAYDYNIDNKKWSDMVARTETQRALNNGRVYGYQQSNTAKTLRWVANPGACPDCSFRSGEIYKVGEAMDLIPYHPMCKCTWIVEEYKTFEEAEKGIKSLPDKFADPEKIYSDPNGVGIMEMMKMDDKQLSGVERLINQGATSRALKTMKQFAKAPAEVPKKMVIRHPQIKTVDDLMKTKKVKIAIEDLKIDIKRGLHIPKLREGFIKESASEPFLAEKVFDQSNRFLNTWMVTPNDDLAIVMKKIVAGNDILKRKLLSDELRRIRRGWDNLRIGERLEKLSELNNALRKTTYVKFNQEAVLLEKIFTDTIIKTKNIKNVKVYRGVKGNVANKIKKSGGKNIEFNVIDSWSRDKKVAKGFAGEEGIILEKEISAKYIYSINDYSQVSGYYEEREIVAIHTKLSNSAKIIKKTLNRDLLYINDKENNNWIRKLRKQRKKK